MRALWNQTFAFNLFHVERSWLIAIWCVLDVPRGIAHCRGRGSCAFWGPRDLCWLELKLLEGPPTKPDRSRVWFQTKAIHPLSVLLFLFCPFILCFICLPWHTQRLALNDSGCRWAVKVRSRMSEITIHGLRMTCKMVVSTWNWL